MKLREKLLQKKKEEGGSEWEVSERRGEEEDWTATFSWFQL